MHALCRDVRGYLAGIGSNRLLCVYLESHSGCEVVSLGASPITCRAISLAQIDYFLFLIFFFVVLGIEVKASCLAGKFSTPDCTTILVFASMASFHAVFLTPD